MAAGAVRLTVRVLGLLLLCTAGLLHATKRLWGAAARPTEAPAPAPAPAAAAGIDSSSNHSRSGGGGGKPSLQHAPPLPAANSPRKPPIVVLDLLRPKNGGLYPASHPFHVAAHALGAGLERRDWAAAAAAAAHNHTHPQPIHLVVRLPDSAFADDLRPFTRLLLALVLLSAAEEAGVPHTRFQQLHFVAPSAPPALMRGSVAAGGNYYGLDGDPGTIAPVRSSSTTSMTAAAAAAAAATGGASAGPEGGSSALDGDGVRHWRWSVHLERQPPAERFTRPWRGPVDEVVVEGTAAAAATRDSKAVVGGATAAAAPAAPQSAVPGVLERSLKKRPLTLKAAAASTTGGAGRNGGVSGPPGPAAPLPAPLLLGAAGGQALVTRVADQDLHDLGGFGRQPAPWADAFGLLRAPGRAARVRALAWGLCNVTSAPAPAPAWPLKVVVYNRDATRRLRNAHAAVAALRARLPPGSEVLLVVHREDLPVCELVELLADADALVTPHGFSAMLSVLLPPGSLLVEINPYRFGGFEPYARVAAAFGVGHWAVHSEPVRKLQPALLDVLAPLFLPGHDPRRCKDSSLCRFLARQFPVRLDEEEQLASLASRIQEAGAQRRRGLGQQQLVV